jgi:hypothetical protein
MLVPGPTPVAYVRRLSGHEAPEADPRPPAAAECLTYVAAAAPQLRIPILDGRRLTIVWQNETARAGAVEQFRTGILREYSSMMRQLRDVGLLSATDAAALAVPQVELRVADRRAARTPRSDATRSGVESDPSSEALAWR